MRSARAAARQFGERQRWTAGGRPALAHRRRSLRPLVSAAPRSPQQHSYHQHCFLPSTRGR
jgi:hypothetical protein